MSSRNLRYVIFGCVFLGVNLVFNAAAADTRAEQRKTLAADFIGTHVANGIEITLLPEKCMDVEMLKSLGGGYEEIQHYQVNITWKDPVKGSVTGCWAPVPEIHPNGIAILFRTHGGIIALIQKLDRKII